MMMPPKAAAAGASIDKPSAPPLPKAKPPAPAQATFQVKTRDYSRGSKKNE